MDRSTHRRYRIVSGATPLFHADLYVAEWSGVEGFVKQFTLWQVRPELCHDDAIAHTLIEDMRRAAAIPVGTASPILDVWRTASDVLIATGFSSGRTLSDVLEGAGGADRPEARVSLFLPILLEVGRALEQAHILHAGEGPIVHGDLRPDFVKLGFDGTVTVSGFGFVRFLPAVSPDGLWSTFRGRCYQPRERHEGGDPDVRSDVFALGAMIAEAISGIPPYGTDDPDHILSLVHAGAPAVTAAARRALPPEILALVDRACADAPGDRHPSAEELVADLHRLVLRSGLRGPTAASVKRSLELCSESGLAEEATDQIQIAPSAPASTPFEESGETHLAGGGGESRPRGPGSGRAEIRDRALDLVAGTSGGRGKALLVVGAPGMGRTHLLAEVASALRASGHGASWLHLEAQPGDRETRYWAALRLLASAVGLGGEPDSRRLASETDRLRLLGLSEAAMEALRGLLGVGPAPEPSRIPGLIGQAVVRCVSALSWEQTTVVCWDNLENIDPGSLGCLAELLSTLATTPTVVLLTAPPGLALPFPRSAVETVELAPLSPDEAEAALLAQLPEAREVDAALRDLLLSRSGGNPSLLEEQTLLLRETGRIAIASGLASLATEGVVPVGVLEKALRHQLLALEDGERALVVAAVLAGPVPNLRTLASALDEPEDAVERGLARISEAHWIFRKVRLGLSARAPLGRAILEAADPDLVARLGGRVARAIWSSWDEVDCGAAEHAATLLARSGDRRTASHVLAEIARVQERRGDPAGAARRYAEALGLVRSDGSQGVETELDLCLSAGRAALSGLLLDEGTASLSQAIGIADRSSSTGAATEARILLGQLLAREGRLAEAVERILEAVAIAREAGDLGALARAYGAVAETYHQWGQFGEAQPYVEAALRTANEAGDPRRLGEHLHLAVNHAVGVGHDERTWRLLRRAREIAEGSGSPLLLCQLARAEGLLHFFGGDPRAALEVNSRGIELARHHGIAELEIVILHNAGDNHVALGNMDEALYFFHESLRRSQASRYDRLTEANEMFIGFIEASCHDLESGFDRLRRAIRRGERAGRDWNLTQGHQLLGRALLARGEIEGAVEHLEEAVQIGGRAGLKYFTEEARRWLGDARSRQRDGG
jgi:tetratricopeptide (TPR) repeat protein